MKLRYVVLLFVQLSFLSQLLAQTKVSGIVTDSASKEPMEYATVFAPNEGIGTITGLDGAFELITTDSIIEIKHIGYKDFRVSIDTLLSDIVLNPEISLDPDIIICVCGVVIRATYEIHPSITYLKQRDIQLNNESSIAPTLNTVPGVFMHSGALNTNRITIRGIGNRNLFGTAKIKAYLAGIPLTNGSGETSLEDIDLSIIDAVTVYKGPASSIYGAGLGGMINLQVSDDIRPTGNAFSLKNTNGSFGLSRSAFTFTRSNYEKSIVNLNLNTTFSDGYRANNEYKRYSFSGFGKFNISEHESVNMLLNYTYLDGEIPSSLDSTDYVDNPEQAAFIWNRAAGYEQTEKVIIGVSYNASLGPHLQQTSGVYILYRDSYEKRPFNILREISTSVGARSEWIVDYPFNGFISNFEFHLGGELFKEDYAWQTYDTDGINSRDELLSDNNEFRFYTNLFTQAKLKVDYRATLTLGLNRNYTHYEYRDYFEADGDQGGIYGFPRQWSPFINLGINLDKLLYMNQDLGLSATVSHGFSPPTLEETLTPDGAINRSIRPEQGWNYELGLRGSINYRFKYGVSFYSMQIEDLLVARRTSFDQFIGVNAGKTVHNGIEATLRYSIKFKDFRLEPFLNYTYADYSFEEFIDEENDYSGNELTGTAPHLLTTGIQFASNTFYGNIIYRFVDAMPMRDDNSIYSDAYQLVDLKVGYKHRFNEDWELNFFTGVNNLFDEKYASMILINAGSFGSNAPRYFYPGLPRNFYLGLEVSFGQ